jgi:hypothetical protein
MYKVLRTGPLAPDGNRYYVATHTGDSAFEYHMNARTVDGKMVRDPPCVGSKCQSDSAVYTPVP